MARLGSFAVIERLRAVGDPTRTEWALYISNRPANAGRIARVVVHREVENRLYWRLDVQFYEDQSRVRSGHAASNLVSVHRIAMNLLRLNMTRKASIKSKRMLPCPPTSSALKLPGIMT